MRMPEFLVQRLDQQLGRWWHGEPGPAGEPAAPARLRSLGALLGQYAGVGGDSPAVAPAVESVVCDCWRDATRLGKRFGVAVGALVVGVGLVVLFGIVAVAWGI